MKRFFLPILFFTACTFITCQSTANSAHGGVSSADTAHYEMHSFHAKSKFLANAESGQDTTFISVNYPIFKDSITNKLVKSAIFTDGEQTMDQLATSFIEAYDEYAKEATVTTFAAWYHQRYIKVHSNTPLFISLINSVEEYTGGAHGNHYNLFKSYDLSSKKEIMLEDLIIKNNLPQLVNIAEARFREHENIAKDSSLSDSYFFDDGIFTLADNFALERDHLLFYYNPYEIKSYAEGDTELRIPLKDIKDLLSPKGIQYINSFN